MPDVDHDMQWILLLKVHVVYGLFFNTYAAGGESGHCKMMQTTYWNPVTWVLIWEY